MPLFARSLPSVRALLVLLLLLAAPGPSVRGGEGPDDAETLVRLFDRLADVEVVESPLLDGDSPFHGLARGTEIEERAFPGVLSWLPRRVGLPWASGARLAERVALFLPPPTTLELEIEVPEGARLEAELGILGERRFGRSPEGDGVRFEVAFRPRDGAERVLFTRHVHPAERAKDRGWVPAAVDLAPVAGLTGTLVLRTRPSAEGEPEDIRGDLAFVAHPAIVRARAAGRPNVLLIGVDTLRADHLGCYGYARDTSPHLDALATGGIRFHRAIAPAPWTLPSFTSLLTSLYPSRHGAGRGGRGGWSRAHPDALFLAEILYARGYRTAGIVANHLISPKYGLQQGFELYSHPVGFRGMESVRIDTPLVVEFLERHRDVPFFLFWHIMDPHLPYFVPEEIARRFIDPGYEGRFERGVDFQFLVQRPGRRRFAHEGHPRIPEMSDADRRRIVDLYDAEIAETDAAVGRVLAALERLGLADRTVVALTADHGEGLADHGHYHHGYTLYEDQIRVPWLLRVPGGPAGRVVREPVSTLDVGPTLLSAVGVPRPSSMQGRDRLEDVALRGGAVAGEGAPGGASAAPPVFSEYATYDSSALKAVYLGESKYLHDPVFHRESLYDVGEDPLESTDLARQRTEAVRDARPRLDAFREANLRGGRYHLRVHAPAGSRLTGRLTAGEVFDANALVVPGEAERALVFDLERRHLSLDVTLESGVAEVVFWFRGGGLGIELALDGEPFPGPILAGEAGTIAADRPVPRDAIPATRGESLTREVEGPVARLWLEAAGLRPLPTVDTEEDLERLRALGYIR